MPTSAPAVYALINAGSNVSVSAKDHPAPDLLTLASAAAYKKRSLVIRDADAVASNKIGQIASTGLQYVTFEF